MEQASVLTSNQKAFLSVLKTSSYIKDTFYFTGGTALTEYYLHHRYSDDLDFFSEQQFDNQILLSLVENWSKQLHFTYTSRFVEVVYRFLITCADGENLKIDFAYYPYKRIHSSIDHEGIMVDSLFDIGVNKINTLSQRMEIKDFVDSYFIWKTESMYDLIHGQETKFKQEFDPLVFSSDLLTIDSFTTLPRMIEPLTLEQLQIFFHEKAMQLAQPAVE